jgi:hypothetical protein
MSIPIYSYFCGFFKIFIKFYSYFCGFFKIFIKFINLLATIVQQNINGENICRREVGGGGDVHHPGGGGDEYQLLQPPLRHGAPTLRRVVVVADGLLTRVIDYLKFIYRSLKIIYKIEK